MGCKINSYSCVSHKNKIDQIQLISVLEDFDTHVDLTGDHSFVVLSHQTRVITFFVTQQVTSSIQIFCADHVDLTVRLIMLHPQSADISLSIIICGDFSKVSVLGMCALAEQQSVIIKTSQIHCGKHSQSNLVVQGLLTGQALLKYDGMIRIEKDACGTYALQNNKNILLSHYACAISIPNIEVLNHDVQCYHGAAIGKFDLQQMHYMQTRGLDEQMIKQLLVQELFAQVLNGYEKREFILQTVYEKI